MELVQAPSDSKNSPRGSDQHADSDISMSTTGGGTGEASSTGQSQILEEWSECIRSLTVSSGENTKNKLLDNTNSYWQSCSSSQGNVSTCCV